MEKTQINQAQEQKLLAYFKKRSHIWIVFLIIGIVGLIPVAMSFFHESGPYYYTSPTFAMFALGIVFWSQSADATKKIKNNAYLTYKTECKKVNMFGYAYVENNEILSKKLAKPFKRIEIIGTVKSIRAGDNIGILQTGKEFWAFPLND